MKTFLKSLVFVLTLTTGALAAPINQGPIYIYQPLGGSSGGGGTGCVPAGAANNILTDTGAGACGSDNSAQLLAGALSLGASGTLGSIIMGNATSGTITLQPATGALGTVTLSLPDVTDTLVGKTTTDTFTNKSISGSTNTFTNIPNSALTNSSMTIGSTNIALGATSTTLAGLTTVTATTFTGALVGNASTATSATTAGSATIATTATNANNGATVASTTNASFFPLFAASSSNSNQPFNLGSGLTFNPSTNVLTTNTFVGALTGTASGNLTASNSATLTNKTFDTAGTGNSFSINGVAVTTNTGTGAVARAASPTLSGIIGGTITTSGIWTFSNATHSALFSGGPIGFGTTAPTQLGSFVSSSSNYLNLLRSFASGNAGNSQPIQGIEFGTADSSTFTEYYGARIYSDTNQAWTAGSAQGANLRFQTVPNGSTTLTTVFTLGSDGSAIFPGVISNAGITTDSAQTTATVCEDTTSHKFYFGSGTLGICKGTSSRRFKHNIEPLTPGLGAVLALKPVSFYMNKGYGDPKKQMYGFIAEDAVKVLPKLTGHDAKGKVDAFDYLGVVPVLVKAVQQQEREIRQQQVEISELKSELRKVH